MAMGSGRLVSDADDADDGGDAADDDEWLAAPARHLIGPNQIHISISPTAIANQPN